MKPANFGVTWQVFTSRLLVQSCLRFEEWRLPSLNACGVSECSLFLEVVFSSISDIAQKFHLEKEQRTYGCLSEKELTDNK